MPRLDGFGLRRGHPRRRAHARRCPSSCCRRAPARRRASRAWRAGRRRLPRQAVQRARAARARRLAARAGDAAPRAERALRYAQRAVRDPAERGAARRLPRRTQTSASATVNPIARPVFGDIPGGSWAAISTRSCTCCARRRTPMRSCGSSATRWKPASRTSRPSAPRLRLDRGVVEYYEWRLDRITLARRRAWPGLLLPRHLGARRGAQALEESREALEEADRRKDEFLATLAHELRNPLAPIRNCAAHPAARRQRERRGASACTR